MNNHSVSEQLAYEHLADLRRDATTHPGRSHARADRAQGRAQGPVRHAALRLPFHSRATAVGCEA
jgi:hypothetical protein